MYPQVSVTPNNFTSDNYSNEQHLDHIEKTVAQKLAVIKRCLEEKQFSKHYRKAHDFKNRINNRSKSPITRYKVKKISTVILNKQMLALSSVELNSLIKSTTTVHDSELVGFLSVFSDSKVTDSFLTLEYDRTRHHKRRTSRTFSRYGYINSLALYVGH